MFKALAQINEQLNTIEELLELGEIVRLKDGGMKSKDVILKTIFDNDECLVGIAVYEHKGDSTPSHRHEGISQYLIQYRGKVSVTFENGAYRILQMGECVSIPKGELHKVSSLTDNAEQIFICIPAEKGYRIMKDDIIAEQNGGR